jgi:SAM-dependent methyltransferase
MITREINWVESIDPNNGLKLKTLENQLADFYSSNPDYYANIDFTSNNWVDKTEIGYQEILNILATGKTICEVGCGSANILKHHTHFESLYSGCDFSEQLMLKNKQLYPSANFKAIKEPNLLPFPDGSFDLVFSVFVIEHSTNPARFLDECSRLLKPSGKLIILCPDFLGSGRMTSQRAGWSEGTASQKLRRRRPLDALLTLFDNRIRIPLRCRQIARKISKAPLFLVNIAPVVFEDTFLPDVDAVYVTCKAEIKEYLKSRFGVVENSPVVSSYENERRIIFLSLIKF